jgi:branched-subunit amino acid ABC-type transport system permease component
LTDFWPFIISGIATGSVYGIAATGLVLTYKTSGIFNFAHGALAAASAYAFYELHFRRGLAWPLATLVCVGVVGPVAGFCVEYFTRRLANVTSAMRIVGSLGLLLVVQGAAQVRYGTSAINFPQFLPQKLFRIGGVNLTADRIIVTVLGLVTVVALFAFFRFSRLGLYMRAVVDNPGLLDLAGTSPRRIRALSWAIGCAFASLSGILLAPLIGLDAILLTLLVVQAFGAAAVGGFTSLPLTYAGALAIGVVGALSTKYVADIPSLAGLPPSLPFLVLFLALLLTPRGRLVDTAPRRSVGSDTALPPAAVWAGRGLLLAGLVVVPHVVGTRLPVYISALIFVLMFISLRPLIRTSGQVALCHAAFAAIGAVGFAHFSTGLGLPWLVAFLAAGLCTVPVGAFLALPAIRLPGLYLSLATFGFGILLERMVYGMGIMFGYTGRRIAPRPHLPGLDFSSDTTFYYLCLVVVVLAAVGMSLMYRSRLGRLLEGLAESPVAVTVLGANTAVSRLLVFCISAFVAGLAGALFAAAAGTVSGVGFGAFLSLTMVAVLMISGRGEITSVCIAAALMVVAPSYIRSSTYLDFQPVAFGALAMYAATRPAGGGRLGAGWRRIVAGRGAAGTPATEAGGDVASLVPALSGRGELR